ncbi:MAG: cytochrome c [Rhodobacteraceae bacterium]|nr:MAG: cytochrome c [Paracoccaceae bacterium]
MWVIDVNRHNHQKKTRMGLRHWTSPDERLSTAGYRIADAANLLPDALLSAQPSRSVPALCHLVAGAALLLVASPVFSQTNQTQSEQGEYIARAAGCMSCHGEDLAGGYQVETPMGTIVASNISPSQEYGIGGYSRDDLARVLREGVSPDRRLYPAMPYASFRGMTDTDIDVLHIWLQDQEPVERAPDQRTDLPFPFNIRTGVMAWNWLYLGDRDLPQFGDPVLSRGAYLVDHLGHCGECHTPRNDLFGVQNDQYLAGEVIDGWLAPNLTSHPVSGLGAWAAQDIVDYLGKGTAGNIVQAAGPMGTFVQHGTSHLDEDDLFAIAAYLQTIPAIDTRSQDIPLLVPMAERDRPQHRFNQIREEMTQAQARDDLSEPERLFLDHCAACHGVSGQGQPQAFYPPLVQNAALRREDPRNLLTVLSHGVPAGKLYRMPAMPGFADELSDDQIAMLANYTRTTFGGRQDSTLTAADVGQARDQDDDMPATLRSLQVAAWVALIAGIALLVGGALLWWVLARRRGLRRQEGVKP